MLGVDLAARFSLCAGFWETRASSEEWRYLQSLGRGQQEGLITRERTLLESLIEFLTGFGAPAGDVDLLRQTLSDMGDPFMLVVVGEFNAGKSAFINALVGHEVAAEGSLPTTERVTILKHSSETTLRERPGGVVEKGFPSDYLRDLHRGHAGDQRRHPLPRGAVARVRAPLGPHSVRDQRREVDKPSPSASTWSSSG